MKLKTIAITLCSLLATSSAFAKDLSLGKTVLFEAKNEKAIVALATCRYVKAIKIEAEKEAFISKVVVGFNNSEERTIQFQRQFDKGEGSDWRKFSYPRCVKNIQVYGRAEDKTAAVKILGYNDK